MSEFITPNDIAEEIGANPRDVRRVLRRMTADRAGKGGTWALTPEIAEAVKREIANSSAGLKARKVTPVLRSEFVATDED